MLSRNAADLLHVLFWRRRMPSTSTTAAQPTGEALSWLGWEELCTFPAVGGYITE